MNTLRAIPGRLVRSKAGRDAGRYFVIIDVIDVNYVVIADGDLRRLSSPKKKKLKHLELRIDVLDSIAAKLDEGKKVFDAELRSAIAAYTGSHE